MNPLDTLTILIEADAAGLNTQLQKAGASIQSFISEMNSQSINWEQILAGTISPAIITGIAATFAMALEQELSTLSSATNAANTTDVSALPGENPATGSQAIQSSALAIQAQTGQAAGDIATALGTATQVLGNYAQAEDLVSTAAQFATATGEDLNTIVKETAPLFADWGVKTADTSSTLTDLFGTAAQGKVSVDQLSTSLTGVGATLEQYGVTIPQATAAIESLSNQVGMTGPAAVNTFGVITKALSTFQGKTAFTAMTGINLTKALKDGGLPEVMADLEKKFSGMSESSALILGNEAGFDANTINHLRDAATSSGTLVKSTQAIIANSNTLGTSIENNLSPLAKMKVAWGKVLTDITGLGKILATPVVSFVTNLLDDINALFHPIDTLKSEWSSLTKSLSQDNPFAGGNSFLNGINSSPQVSGLSSGSSISTIFGEIGSFFTNLLKINTTTATPAGTAQTTNNVTTYNITSGSVANGTGTGVQSLAKTSHDASLGYQ